jgi:hypothetical protein
MTGKFGHPDVFGGVSVKPCTIFSIAVFSVESE